MNDLIDRQAAIDYCYALINAENPSDPSDEWNYSQERINQTEVILQHLEFMPSAQPEQRWIPVTLETLPNPNSVVVACGKKGTWDYGTYRGWHGDIHSWKWKKNTIKHVYWWMYKDDALPEPYREEGDE